jgi:hypothetical protein
MTRIAFAAAMRYGVCSYNRLGAIIQAFALIAFAYGYRSVLQHSHKLQLESIELHV